MEAAAATDDPTAATAAETATIGAVEEAQDAVADATQEETGALALEVHPDTAGPTATARTTAQAAMTKPKVIWMPPPSQIC